MQARKPLKYEVTKIKPLFDEEKLNAMNAKPSLLK
jgi:hypothetical protein